MGAKSPHAGQGVVGLERIVGQGRCRDGELSKNIGRVNDGVFCSVGLVVWNIRGLLVGSRGASDANLQQTLRCCMYPDLYDGRRVDFSLQLPGPCFSICGFLSNQSHWTTLQQLGVSDVESYQTCSSFGSTSPKVLKSYEYLRDRIEDGGFLA
jgi:hypothetical protein